MRWLAFLVDASTTLPASSGDLPETIEATPAAVTVVTKKDIEQRAASLGVTVEIIDNGAGIGFVDLEQGWTLDHEDLPANIPVIGPGQQFPQWTWHGTAVLGIVAAAPTMPGLPVPSCAPAPSAIAALR